MNKLILSIFCLFSLVMVSHANELIINQNIQYPHVASPARANKIKSEYKKVIVGMDAKEVLGILGQPNETHPLYEPKIYKPDQIGFTHWYIIQRMKEHGSVDEKKEILVRVSYDLQWKVTALEHWGFNE